MEIISPIAGTIHEAALEGDIVKVKTLLAENPGLVNDKEDECGLMTPLHLAALCGHKKVVELLLANKADVNAKDKGGYTPLYLAMAKGHKEMMELLLTNNADVNAKTKCGDTPLRAAIKNNKKDVAKLLRQHGGKE